jgi:hypothetical protein
MEGWESGSRSVQHFLVLRIEPVTRGDMLRQRAYGVPDICSEIPKGWLDEAVVGKEAFPHHQRRAWTECDPSIGASDWRLTWNGCGDPKEETPFVVYTGVTQKGISGSLAMMARSTGGWWEASDYYLVRLLQDVGLVEERSGIPPFFRSRGRVPC